MLNRFIKAGIAFCLLFNLAFVAKAQNNTESQSKKQDEKQKFDPKNPTFTAEQVAEGFIIATGGYGGRETLKQVRSKGVESGKFRRTLPNLPAEEYTYNKYFLRGDDMTKDRIRIDQKSPAIEYSLIFGEGNIWGIINGTNFTPRPDIARAFTHQLWYSIDSLLRYKENGSTINLFAKETHKGVEVYPLEVIDKENRKIRYYISAKLLRVLWFEYEEPLTESGTPVKYMRRFYDYRIAQGTLIPFKTVFYENGKQIEETTISTITYGLKVDEGMFIKKQTP